MTLSPVQVPLAHRDPGVCGGQGDGLAGVGAGDDGTCTAVCTRVRAGGRPTGLRDQAEQQRREAGGAGLGAVVHAGVCKAPHKC